MRRNIGNALALYPMPVTVIGAMNGDEPTWTLVAHVGIIGHNRVTVSLAAAHFINDCIKKTGRLSVNLVSEPMLPQVAVAGAVSGAKQSKAGLFGWEAAENGAPLISEAPVSVACAVVDEDDLTEAGKIDYARVKPVLFEFPTYSYLRTGDVIGPCADFARAARA